MASTKSTNSTTTTTTTRSPTPTTAAAATAEPLTLNILSLNCWGLQYVSQRRRERLDEISRRIASARPAWDIVGLQEVWVYSDYVKLRAATAAVLPYGKFYHCGLVGAGLVILSRFPIVESSMHPYVLNGRPTAFWRGDWYAGKGVACAVLELDEPGRARRAVEVFNTHLHAPYEAGGDSYLCHRTAQAWQISKLLRASVQKGHIPVALGDFNMLPSSLAHHIITTHGLVADCWLSKYPSTPTSLSANRDARYNIQTLGTTCDSALNTWRLEAHQVDLPRSDSPDPRAQRLDYIFHCARLSKVVDISVGMTDPMKLPGSPKPGNGVTRRGMASVSDHFSVEVRLELPLPLLISLGGGGGGGGAGQEAQDGHERPRRRQYLDTTIIDEIQVLTQQYTKRETWEYTWRIAHFWFSVLALVALHVAVWWNTYPGVAFLITFLSWVIAVTGVVNGLIGLLFMGFELSALKEFDEEIKIYRKTAEDRFRTGQGQPKRQVLGAVDGVDPEQRIQEELVLERATVDQNRSHLQ